MVLKMFATDQEIIDSLFRYGHFSNPKVLNVAEVNAGNLPKLTIRDKVVEEAVRSYQSMLAVNLEPLTMHYLHRSAIHDGIVGPATRTLFTLERCGVPDYGFGAKAVGNGSWPMPCQKEGVKFHINKASMPSSIVSKWSEIQAKVVKAYADIGLKLVEVSSADLAQMPTFFGSFFGSTIGLSSFNNESCSDETSCKLSNSYVGANASLLAHEWGHNCNLGHTRNGIMNPSILPDPIPFGWLKTDPSYFTLVRFFGGEPIDVEPPGPPNPPVPNPSQHPFIDFIRWLFGI